MISSFPQTYNAPVLSVPNVPLVQMQNPVPMQNMVQQMPQTLVFPQMYVPQVVYPDPFMNGIFQYQTPVQAVTYVPEYIPVPACVMNNQATFTTPQFPAPSYIQSPVHSNDQVTFPMSPQLQSSPQWVQNTTVNQTTFISGGMQADGGEGSESAEVLLWSYHFQKPVGSIAKEFEQEGINFEAYTGKAFLRALRSTTRDQNLHCGAFARICESESTSHINFFCPEQEHAYLNSIVSRGDFEERIKAELRRNTHLLNTHINGIKQTVITTVGWDIVEKLLPTMTNKDSGLLREVQQQEQFTEENRTKFYKILDPKKAHAKGSALRGPTCVVVRPKKTADLFRMLSFLDEVIAQVEISASSVIVSHKDKKQNKGYSIYLDVGCKTNVDMVFNIGHQQGFEGAKVALAPDCDKN